MLLLLCTFQSETGRLPHKELFFCSRQWLHHSPYASDALTLHVHLQREKTGTEHCQSKKKSCMRLQALPGGIVSFVCALEYDLSLERFIYDEPMQAPLK